jgi:HEPN domain-containing protein
LKLDLRFIGVGLRPEAQAQLGALAQALGAEMTNPAESTALDAALQRILIVQPRVAEVEQVTLTLNEGAAHANTAVSRIGGGNYDDADRELQQAADALARGVVTLPDARQPQPVRELLDLARQRRDEQQQMIDAARALTRASRSSDEVAAAEARRAYNAASARHNRIIGKINELQEQIIKGVVTSPGGGS